MDKERGFGLILTKDVKHRESIFAIPASCFISVDSIGAGLKELMEQCPSLFSGEETRDSELLQLTLYLMQEIKLGKKSKLYPYLQLMPEDLVPLCDWGQEVLAEL